MKPAAGARRQRPDAERRGPAADSPVLVEAEDFPALDVDPVERRLARHPYGPFAKHGMDVGDADDVRLARHGDGR